MKRFVCSLPTILLIGLTATSFASSIDFSLSATTTANALDYAGGANPLTGTNIPVSSMTGAGTPLNNGVTVLLPGAVLDFKTGAETGSSATGWDFGSGGMIEVCSNPACTKVLATGSFTGTPEVNEEGGVMKVVAAIGIDLKNPSIANFYGEPLGHEDMFDLTYFFKACGLPPSKFRSIKGSGNGSFDNDPVSEPASLALLGAGLLGIAGLARKKLVR